MQHDFIHHPDGRIVIEGESFPLNFWNIVEPDYSLPVGYIGRLFTKMLVHHLIREGNNTHDQADVENSELINYISLKAIYQTAYQAHQDGANVFNDNGNIIISGPPLLSVDKSEIINDGVDAVTITCDLEDANLTDEIRWSVIAPDGSIQTDVEFAVYGVDTWVLTTSHIGVHKVVVETDFYGTSFITFKGI